MVIGLAMAVAAMAIDSWLQLQRQWESHGY